MAWTGNFKTQITDLAGTLTVTDDAAIQQWILDGCYDVISKAVAKNGEDEVWKFVAKSGAQSTNHIDIDEIRTIAGVVRNSTFVTKGKWGLKNKYYDANSIYAATANSPIWYIDNSKLSIYPSPTVSETANYYYVPEYVIDSSWDDGVSAIDNYPSEYYYHVMLYAAIQVLHRRMLDSTVPTISAFEPLPIPPDSLGAAAIAYVSAASSTISTIDVDSFTGAPTYTAPTTSLSALEAYSNFEGTLGSLVVVAVPPDSPVMTSVSYTPPSNEDASSPTVSTTGYVAPGTSLPVFSLSLSSLPSAFDINSITVPSATITAPNITAEGVDTLPLPDVTTNVPFFSQAGASNARIGFGTGTGQQFAALATKTITSLSVNAVPPDTPVISTVSYTPATAVTVGGVTDMSVGDIVNTGTVAISSVTAASSNQPNYVAPDVMGAGSLLSEMEGGTIGESAPGFAPDFEKWFSVLGQLIEDEEDTELASAQMQKISAYINAYQADVQNALNEFNQESQVYQQLVQQGTQNANATNQAVLNDIQRLIQENQADLQKDQAVAQANLQKDIQEDQTDTQNAQAKALQDAQQTVQGVIANNSALVQKYQADFAVYQGEVSTQVQEYGQNFQKDIQLWQNTQTQAMQQHSQTMQDALNVFNAQNARYQANIQAEMLRAQTLAGEYQKEADIAMQAKIQDYTFELSEWAQEVQRYQANVGSQVQEYQQELARYQAGVTAETQEFQAKVSKYNTEQQDSAQTANIANQAHLQKAQGDLQVAVRNKDKDLEAAIQNAINTMQSIIQDDQVKTTAYQAELQAYQAEVNEQVAEYTQNFQKALQTWTAEQANRLARYQSEQQDSIQEFNEDNAAFQADVQKQLAEYQADIQIAMKNGDNATQVDITNRAKALETTIAVYSAAVQKYQSELQGYAADISAYQADASSKLQKYQADLQAEGVGYQWLQDQYQRLKVEYERAFAVPQPQQAQG